MEHTNAKKEVKRIILEKEKVIAEYEAEIKRCTDKLKELGQGIPAELIKMPGASFSPAKARTPHDLSDECMKYMAQTEKMAEVFQVRLMRAVRKYEAAKYVRDIIAGYPETEQNILYDLTGKSYTLNMEKYEEKYGCSKGTLIKRKTALTNELIESYTYVVGPDEIEEPQKSKKRKPKTEEESADVSKVQEAESKTEEDEVPEETAVQESESSKECAAGSESADASETDSKEENEENKRIDL